MTRRPYLPTWGLAALTLGLAGRGLDALARSHRLLGVLGSEVRELAGPAVCAFVAVVVVVERRWPAEPRPPAARGPRHDAVFLALAVVVGIPLVTLLGAGSASVLSALVRVLARGAGGRGLAASWPAWLAVPACLVAMDGCNWLSHVAEHRVAPLWRVHALHHSQEEVSVLTTFRVHPLAHAAGFLAATLPVVVVLGDRPLTPVLVTAYLCIGALAHANVGWTFGPLAKVVVSPAYHRIHHWVDGPPLANLGIVLPWWDMLAGRAVFPVPGEPAGRTGLAGRPLPVEHDGGRGTLVAQLVEPFLVAAPGPPGTRTGSGKPNPLGLRTPSEPTKGRIMASATWGRGVGRAARAVAVALGLAVGLAGVAGCGSTSAKRVSGAGPTTSAPATGPTSPGPLAPRVDLGSTALGEVLVDGTGRTLYTYANDAPGSGTSACEGACATEWSPLTGTGAPVAGSGVSGSLAVITRSDGMAQVTIDGHPLYRFAGDHVAGDTRGNGSEGLWNVARPPGAAPLTPATTVAPPAPVTVAPAVTAAHAATTVPRPPATPPTAAPTTRPPTPTPTRPPATTPPATSPPATSPPPTTRPAPVGGYGY